MTFLFIALVMFGAMAVHEGGHYLAARYFGAKLAYRFDWDTLGELKIPSFAWDMPAAFTPRQKKIVAFAGFGLEVAAASLVSILGACLKPVSAFACGFTLFVLVHLLLYPWYAGAESDYNFTGEE